MKSLHRLLFRGIVAASFFTAASFPAEPSNCIPFTVHPPPATPSETTFPAIYPLKPKDAFCAGNVYIIDLPIENGVGSLCIDYGDLTAITFKKKNRLAYKRIGRIGDRQITEKGFTVLPGKKTAACAWGRGFQLIDIAHRKVSYWPMCYDMHDNIGEINVIDEKDMLFAFEIVTSNQRDYPLPPIMKNPEDSYVILTIVALAGKTPLDITERLVDIARYHGMWTVHNATIYYFSEKTSRLLAFDRNLKPVTTALVDSFNALAARETSCTLRYLHFHPTLPFALLGIRDTAHHDSRHFIAVLNGNECTFTPLFNGPVAPAIDTFLISPDGTWIVFSYSNLRRDPPRCYFMRVNPKNPLFLEPPGYLGAIAARNGFGVTTAWTRKPLCFVACDGTALYRWNMEKAAAGKRQDGD